jgi:hypothetical protein
VPSACRPQPPLTRNKQEGSPLNEPPIIATVEEACAVICGWFGWKDDLGGSQIILPFAVPQGIQIVNRRLGRLWLENGNVNIFDSQDTLISPHRYEALPDGVVPMIWKIKAYGRVGSSRKPVHNCGLLAIGPSTSPVHSLGGQRRTGALGATSYWISITAAPQGRESYAGALSTDGLGGSPQTARAASLRQTDAEHLERVQDGLSSSRNPSSSQKEIDGYRFAQPILRARI